MSVGEISQRWMKKFDLPLGRSVQFYGLAPEVQNIDWSGFYGPRGNLNSPGVDDVVEWAKTGRGGQGLRPGESKPGHLSVLIPLRFM